MKPFTDIPKESEQKTKKKKRVRPNGSVQTSEKRLAALAFSGDMKDWRSSVKIGKNLF